MWNAWYLVYFNLSPNPIGQVAGIVSDVLLQFWILGLRKNSVSQPERVIMNNSGKKANV